VRAHDTKRGGRSRLKEPELSPRELTVSFIDQQRYFEIDCREAP
jgi:hypothetical protein